MTFAIVNSHTADDQHLLYPIKTRSNFVRQDREFSVTRVVLLKGFLMLPRDITSRKICVEAPVRPSRQQLYLAR